MHLDRDDRGNSNNTIMVNGNKVINPLRQEVVTIRSIVPGEYVVNAHYYETKEIDRNDPKTGQPVEAILSVIKVNPKAEVVYYGQATLESRGKEVTMTRFTVTPNGGVDNVNTIPKILVKSF
jgi:allantoicase